MLKKKAPGITAQAAQRQQQGVSSSASAAQRSSTAPAAQRQQCSARQRQKCQLQWLSTLSGRVAARCLDSSPSEP